MEVSGVNRLLAMAGEIGIGKTRVVGDVGRRDVASPASETRPQRASTDSGLAITISSAAQQRLAGLDSEEAAAPSRAPVAFAPSETTEADRPAAAPRSRNASNVGILASRADSAPPVERPAFAAYRRANAASADPTVRIRV